MRKNGIIVVAAASMMATASTSGATKAPVVSAMTPLAQGEMVDCHVKPAAQLSQWVQNA
jgi:hypothetical protein